MASSSAAVAVCCISLFFCHVFSRFFLAHARYLCLGWVEDDTLWVARSTPPRPPLPDGPAPRMASTGELGTSNHPGRLMERRVAPRERVALGSARKGAPASRRRDGRRGDRVEVGVYSLWGRWGATGSGGMRPLVWPAALVRMAPPLAARSGQRRQQVAMGARHPGHHTHTGGKLWVYDLAIALPIGSSVLPCIAF